MRWTSCRRSLVFGVLVSAIVLTAAPAADRTQLKLDPSESRASGGFGLAADLDGDTAVVAGWGEPDPQVFVFVRGDGDWLEQQSLRGDELVVTLGEALAIDGDTLVATAPIEMIGSERTGAAYVFVRSGDTWTRQDKLVPSDPHTNSRYGNSVDIDGDTIVVGDNSHDDAHDRQGVAYVYTRSSDVWTQQQRLTASDAAVADFFGSDVAVHGDTIVVGANANDDFGNGSGAAYIFQRTDGTWTETRKLIDGNGGVEEGFGWQVDINEDWVMIASPSDHDAGSYAGSVMVFERSGTTVSRDDQLLSPAPHAGEHFGDKIALHGDRLLVGAYSYNGLGVNTGRAYLYTFDGQSWAHAETIDAPDAAVWDSFGSAVGVSEHVMLVAARTADDPEINKGKVWIFDDTPEVQSTSSAMIPSSITATLPAPTKRPKTPGLKAKGLLDTGPDPVDLTAGGTLMIGTAEFVVPSMTVAVNGRTYSYEDAEVDFTVKAPGHGGSRCTFKLAIEADLTGHVDPNGPLTMSYGSGAIDAEVTVVLDGGKFKLDSSPDVLGTELLHCVKAKAKLKGERRDTFKLKLRFGSDGTPPAVAPEVTVGFGAAFETVLDQAKFTLKKSKWTLKEDPKAEGITKAVLDFGKGQAVITAKKSTLGAFAQGPTPLTILLGIDDQLRAVELRAVVKGKTLKY